MAVMKKYFTITVTADPFLFQSNSHRLAFL